MTSSYVKLPGQWVFLVSAAPAEVGRAGGVATLPGRPIIHEKTAALPRSTWRPTPNRCLSEAPDALDRTIFMMDQTEAPVR